MKEDGIQFAPQLHLQLDNTVKDNKSKHSASGGLKCGFPVLDFAYVGPRHWPLNKKAQWPTIDDAEARSLEVGAHWNVHCFLSTFFFAH